MVSDQAASRVQYGAASELAADLAHPWPEVEHNGRKLRVVTYCYSNKEVRDWLDDYVKAAITRWKEKLSSPPFKGTTNLAWQELHDGNLDPCKRQPRFCFGPTKEWDRENVPGDTLWVNIDHDQGAGGKSTVGYLPPNHENEVAYQHMKLGSEVTVEAIVHELGHVLGMVHEHQRHDCDDYVFFQCENLPRYVETLARVRADLRLPHGEAHKRLCESYDTAVEYRNHGFDSFDFVKDPVGKIHDESLIPFDVDSIMLYSSGSFATPMCVQDINACPLLKYGTTKGKPDKNLLLFIETPTHPSDGDARFIQKWYPSVS